MLACGPQQPPREFTVSVVPLEQFCIHTLDGTGLRSLHSSRPGGLEKAFRKKELFPKKR